jgi:hypothetical protein
MIDRIEFSYFQINNELRERKTPIEKISGAAGKLAIQEVAEGPVKFGRIASTKRDLKARKILAYFVESNFNHNTRQLWMPISSSSLDSLREIAPTSAPDLDKVSAWERAKIIARDTEGYSKYSEDSEALFGEVNNLLAYAGANNSSFEIEVHEGKMSDLPVTEQLAVREALEFGPFSGWSFEKEI